MKDNMVAVITWHQGDSAVVDAVQVFDLGNEESAEMFCTTVKTECYYRRDPEEIPEPDVMPWSDKAWAWVDALDTFAQDYGMRACSLDAYIEEVV